jgi:hypothetical protein
MPTEQPRLSDQFKNEVESPHHLNHVIPEIKNPLPDQQSKHKNIFIDRLFRHRAGKGAHSIQRKH